MDAACSDIALRGLQVVGTKVAKKMNPPLVVLALEVRRRDDLSPFLFSQG